MAVRTLMKKEAWVSPDWQAIELSPLKTPNCLSFLLRLEEVASSGDLGILKEGSPAPFSDSVL